jgi:predicted Na+-dependent transporter
LGAGLVAYFIKGQVVSNLLFSTLIATLFFLMGLHLDTDKMRRNLHRREELSLGILMIYGFTPVLALVMSKFVGGGVADALIAVGVSTAAIGSPVVWSNIGKADDGAAFMISAVSLVVGILLIPVLLLSFDISINLLDLFMKNILVLGAPLGLGISMQKYDNTVFNDMKHHFSKLALWLLILIIGIQAKMLIRTQGIGFLTDIWVAVPVFTAFTVISYTVGYYSAKKLDYLEKTARAIGFSTGSKGIAVALFIASQLSPESVIAVSIYYFIHQVVCGGIAEYYRHSGDLERMLRSVNPAV